MKLRAHLKHNIWSSFLCLFTYILCFVLGELDGIYYGGNRFGSVTDSGTATLKPRPRVRPLLTFLPLVSICYTLYAVAWYPSI